MLCTLDPHSQVRTCILATDYTRFAISSTGKPTYKIQRWFGIILKITISIQSGAGDIFGSSYRRQATYIRAFSKQGCQQKRLDVTYADGAGSIPGQLTQARTKPGGLHHDGHRLLKTPPTKAFKWLAVATPDREMLKVTPSGWNNNLHEWRPSGWNTVVGLFWMNAKTRPSILLQINKFSGLDSMTPPHWCHESCINFFFFKITHSHTEPLSLNWDVSIMSSVTSKKTQ